MTRREDYGSNTEHDAGRFERAHDDTEYRRVAGASIPLDDLPDRSDVEEGAW